MAKVAGHFSWLSLAKAACQSRGQLHVIYHSEHGAISCQHPSSTMSTTTTTTAATDEAGSQIAAKEADFKIVLSLTQFGEFEGMVMLHYTEPLEVHVHKVMNLSLRDTDIVLLSYPKSGTHWVWRVLDMLASGSATYSDRGMECFNLDLAPTEVVDKVSTDVRRVLHTHYPSDLLPAPVKDGRIKVVHVYRHPKAVLTSMFHMQKKANFPDLTLDKLESMVYAEKALYKNPFYYFDKLKEYERDNPNVDIFHLAYEDMKKDAAGCIKQLAAHLNVHASDELCSGIAEAVSFSKQKIREECGNAVQKDTRIYRKGEVDDWKNYMTVAQSERMDKVLADRAASCQFCRRYCPAITTDQGHVYRLSSTS